MGWVSLLALAACAGTPVTQQAQVSCNDPLNKETTAPYRPAAICLAYEGMAVGASPTTGARSGDSGAHSSIAAMKAIESEGRIYFVRSDRSDRSGPPPAH